MTDSKYPEMIKYCDIKRIGHEDNYGIFGHEEDYITITEKVDGGNAQFRLHEGEVIFGTRNNHFRVVSESAQNKQFGSNAEWVLEQIKTIALNPDYIYYGEWCKKHTIHYDFETMPKYIGFDVRDTRTGVFLPYSAMKEEFERLGLPTVPLIVHVPLSEIDLDRLENFVGKSAYYDGLMEGIVIKNYFRQSVYGKQLFAKIVRQEFKEANVAAFNNSGGWIKGVQDDTIKFIETYYTEARIRKAVLRLQDEGGQKLGRELMHHLPRCVIEDIFKEEAWSLVKEFNNVNFTRIKKVAPKKCLQVIDKMMNENAGIGATSNENN